MSNRIGEAKGIKKKSNETIKKDTYNLNLPYFTLDPEAFINIDLKSSKLLADKIDKIEDGPPSVQYSSLLSLYFSNYQGKFDVTPSIRTILPFFYSAALDNELKVNGINLKNGRAAIQNSQFSSYFNTLKYLFSTALGFPVIEKRFADIIAAVDGKDDGDLHRGVGEQSKIYIRYMKLERLRTFHNLIVEFALSLLHNLYWVDFIYNKTNVYNINTYIDKTINLTFIIRDLLYKELEEELPADLIANLLKTKLKKI